MSKMEGFVILDAQKGGAGGEKAGGQYLQNMARPKLADISNLPQKPKPSVQDDKSKSIPTTTKAYIEQLQKENMALVKLLAQRNKIIEQSGIELERLRLTLIKVQEQNQQLAMSHTEMLGELNLGKDRLKALQHELGCKNGLLKARKLKGGEASEVPQSMDYEVNLIKLPEVGGAATMDHDGEKHRNSKRRSRLQSSASCEQLQSEGSDGNRRPFVRRQSARFKAVKSKSVEDSSDRDNTKEPVVENGSTSGSISFEEDNVVEKAEIFKLTLEEENSTVDRDLEKPRNAKRRLRSQSFGLPQSLQSEEKAGNRRFKTAEVKPTEDEPEKDDIKFLESVSTDERPVLENGSTSGSGSATDKDNRCSSGFESKPSEIGRSSLIRPSRLASRKVQSYKERPINIKMRRPE